MARCLGKLRSDVFHIAPCHNIGPRERRKRLWLGVLGTGSGSLLAVVFLFGDGSCSFEMFLVAPLFALGILGFLQAATRTCLVLALLGAWNLDRGLQQVPDPGMRGQLRRRAFLLALGACLGGVMIASVVFVHGRGTP